MIWYIVYIVVWLLSMLFIIKLLKDDNTTNDWILFIVILCIIVSPPAIGFAFLEAFIKLLDWLDDKHYKKTNITIKQLRLKKLKRINRFRFLKISI